ncbi:aldehyde dehydrogenase family protein [Candidatus Nitronereus thalassa]|uniref:Aldehyde dehydrogenase family protein n=1 Tax=Candidatus Nitronereus thalassa TaxID=3020898 RepID=A0ABU3KA29_9BACT|nr:aldehyde dehydrogenase family protein [Candidatus Nitronereus thalassa]MDT7043295.1 aldehyde dehydrogenase family protein [Candidatus Nitronereus thalassa]
MKPLPGPGFLIGTEWREISTRQSVLNPYTGSLVAEVCQAQAQDIEDAIQLSVSAFSTLSELPSHARATALSTIAQQLTSRLKEFAHVMSLESGKPITDARREVQRAIQTFTIASEEAKRLPGETIPMDISPGMEPYLGILRRVSIGPVLGITPFNFPLNLVAHKVAPCLAVGNPILLKPAPQTPFTALLLGEIICGLGLPPGTFSVLPCENDLAESMVRDPRIQALSFTGSASVGWRLKEKAGKKRVALELGGNAAVIIEPDANLSLAAQRCATGGFSYAGQTCISVQRIYLHQDIYDPFLKLLLDQIRALPCGDPLQESTVVGPLINQQTAIRVESWIQEAIKQGAECLLGGTRQNAIVAPTVLANVSPTMKVSCEEIFGPVVTVSRYQDFSEVLRRVNDSPYGLQAGIYTQDINRIFQAYRELEVGAVLANEIPTWRADHMPYGGVKDSGLGREGVRYAMQELTEPKLLVLSLPQ